jgi:hypothetical protein
MADFGVSLFSLLTADPSFEALADNRVYPTVLPQNCVFPAVAYTVISDRQTRSLGGFTSGQRNALVQVDCYARTRDAAQALADAVADVLSSYTTPELCSSQVSRRDLYDDEAALHRVSTDYSLWSNT